jgi:hypothetical protein
VLTSRSHAHKYEAKYVPLGLDRLRAVLFRENCGERFAWVCIGLEKDIASQGNDPTQAVSRFERALSLETDLFRIEGKSYEQVGPSPQIYHDLYDSAQFKW